MNNRIIIGTDGFVGSYIVKYSLEQNKTVLALDMKETAHRLEPHRNLTYMQFDILDTTAMLEKIPYGIYDTFIHFAWSGSAGKANLNYNNALNTVECLKVAKELGCHKFICMVSILVLWNMNLYM